MLFRLSVFLLVFLSRPSVGQRSTRADVANVASNCSFVDMQAFFTYVHKHDLNVTAEVERCQNLCLMTYGVGNPDLSGIGMMFRCVRAGHRFTLWLHARAADSYRRSYTFQTALTVLLGPVFRVFLLLSSQPFWAKTSATQSGLHKVLSNPDVQIVFWEANGFIVFASAIAALVRMRQRPTIFEIAQIQVLMFMQLNSLIITFFCLLHPINRWWQRFFQFLLGFAVAMAALFKSRLNRVDEDLWLLAGLGCVDKPSYKTITPIPFHSAIVWVAAAICMSAFLVQSYCASQLAKIPEWKERSRTIRIVLRCLEVFWGFFVVVSLAAMVVGLVTLWRQRGQLRAVAGDYFEDHVWGFGQVAALFTWIPIPVEMSYRVNGEWLVD